VGSDGGEIESYDSQLCIFLSWRIVILEVEDGSSRG
jgi:hypothetical protein